MSTTKLPAPAPVVLATKATPPTAAQTPRPATVLGVPPGATMVQPVGTVVQRVAPLTQPAATAVQPVGSVIQPVGGILGGVAPPAASTIQPVTTLLGPMGSVLTPVTGPVGTVLSPVTGPVVGVLAPVTGPGGGVLAPVTGPGGAVLAPVTGPVGAVVAPITGPVGAVLAPGNASIGSLLSPGSSRAGAVLVPLATLPAVGNSSPFGTASHAAGVVNALHQAPTSVAVGLATLGAGCQAIRSAAMRLWHLVSGSRLGLTLPGPPRLPNGLPSPGNPPASPVPGSLAASSGNASSLLGFFAALFNGLQLTTGMRRRLFPPRFWQPAVVVSLIERPG
ncbi:MAG: hypothetical protein M3024_03310 [Candidatus Dormibacteraeota bacterium]|nr:hypothetical protein [Candidatus Dormibacteraeota bacterium]